MYTPAGTSIVTVLATDADEGTNSEIVYSFINEPTNSKFKINPTTGVVTASTSLAADAGKLFHLEVPTLPDFIQKNLSRRSYTIMELIVLVWQLNLC